GIEKEVQKLLWNRQVKQGRNSHARSPESQGTPARTSDAGWIPRTGRDAHPYGGRLSNAQRYHEGDVSELTGQGAGSEGGGTDPAHHEGAGREEADFKRSEEHTSELQSRENLVCRLLLE